MEREEQMRKRLPSVYWAVYLIPREDEKETVYWKMNMKSLSLIPIEESASNNVHLIKKGLTEQSYSKTNLNFENVIKWVNKADFPLTN